MSYEEFTHLQRPLFGYELNPPNPQWPNGAKIAVTFVVEYTEGAESSPEHGDESSEGEYKIEMRTECRSMEIGVYQSPGRGISISHSSILRSPGPQPLSPSVTLFIILETLD